jgi:hypothetical protein
VGDFLFEGQIGVSRGGPNGNIKAGELIVSYNVMDLVKPYAAFAMLKSQFNKSRSIKFGPNIATSASSNLKVEYQRTYMELYNPSLFLSAPFAKVNMVSLSFNYMFN